MASKKTSKTNPPKVSRVKQTILAIAIAIVLAMFIGWGIHTFYPGPKRQDFCQYESKPTPPETMQTNESCISGGGSWFPNAQNIKCPEGQACPSGWCDYYTACNKLYDDDNRVYTRNIFVIATILGIIAVVLGGVVLRLESVSSGIMGGGVLAIIYGIIRYWMDASNYLRFFILGLILAILIWMGYKKMNPNR